METINDIIMKKEESIKKYEKILNRLYFALKLAIVFLICLFIFYITILYGYSI